MEQKKLLFIDADNYIIRYLHSYKDDLSLFKYLINGLKNLISDFDPDGVIVCYDSGKSEFRKKLFPEYKSNREKTNLTPEDIAFLNRKKTVKEEFLQCCTYLGCHLLGSYGVEADDIISLCVRKFFKNCKCVIVSADMDYLQLVNSRVSLFSPTKKIMYDIDEAKQLFNLQSVNLLRVYAVMTKVLKGDECVSVLKKFKTKTY